MKLITLLYVALGSALGGSLRYVLGLLMQHFFSSTKYFHPTFVVNFIGCFVMGVLFAVSTKQNWNSKTTGFLLVGLLGGFTTFSSFGLDIFRLLKNGETLTAFGYLLLSILIGLIAVFIGFEAFKS